MARSTHTAEEIQLELDRVAALMSADSEDQSIEFHLPTPVEMDEDWPFEHNWDVVVECPEGMEDFVERALSDVAGRWDLETD
ncbi:hypothetical protein ACNFJ7_02025 [Sphingomonas sp. HT-1]|uniref:hypothetical protein n=1 Tax=unclassified Sphingomonas TaxID=196159 RepID=UPI00037C33B7|nr:MULTISPECIES: hypothetical protein [unclassified Sphingomonas]KTF68649.1 hypothetical protein ATB93_13060 [Sphingomonas sp. WG]